ncbi:MAG: hypothetical protein WCF04_12270 [Candidatus Nanopelagicales bacterium]
MGDPEEDTRQLRRSGRRFAAGIVAMVVAGIGIGALLGGQVPPVAAVGWGATSPVLASSVLDGQAGLVAQRLAEASGRTLQSVAEGLPGPSADLAGVDAPVVAGAMAAATEYAATLARLDEAEEAAAKALARSKEELEAAVSKQRAAAEALAAEEASAAREVDAAIAAAIAAAQAQNAYGSLGTSSSAQGPADGSSTKPSTGAATSTEEVLSLVRKFFPTEEVGNAMAVSRCESGHRNVVGARNSNGTRDYGIFQINDGGTLQAALRRVGVSYSSTSQARDHALDPLTNVRMAAVIWQSRGWQPWTCAAKVGVVAGLYQRARGPMYGKFDDHGRPR